MSADRPRAAGGRPCFTEEHERLRRLAREVVARRDRSLHGVTNEIMNEVIAQRLGLQRALRRKACRRFD